MNLFTMYMGAKPMQLLSRADQLRADGAAFFQQGVTVSRGMGEWEGIAEPALILAAYTTRGKIACMAWAAGISRKYGEVCVACEWRPAPGFRLVYADKGAS